MAKIHSILQKSDFYYQLALEQAEARDFTAAIKNLHKAISISSRDEYYIELAELYNEVGSFEASNQVYFNLLAKRPSAYYLFAVSRNYIEMDRDDLATEFAYNTFIGLAKKMSEEPIERLSAIGENDMFEKVFSKVENEKKEPKLINIAERREENLMQEAYELFHQGDYDKIIMQMLTIPKSSDNYADALELICIAAIENGDKDMAIAAAKELFEKDNENITAFRVLTRYKVSLVEGEEYDENAFALSLISAMKISGADDKLRMLASLFLEEKKYEQFYNASYAAYTLNDANNKGLFRLTLSAFIMGKKEEGERALNKYCELYPHDKLAKFIRWRFDKKNTKADWKKLPSSFFGDIIDEYYMVATNSNHSFLTEREQDLLDLILSGGIVFDYLEIIEFALEKKGAVEFFVEKLVDSSIDAMGRLEILKILILHDVERRVSILLPDGMTECQLRNPGKLPQYSAHFKMSYSETYAELLLSGYKPSPRRLGIIVRALAKTQSTSNKMHIIAAIIHYHYLHIEGEEIGLPQLAEIYSTTVPTLKKYLAIYQFDY